METVPPWVFRDVAHKSTIFQSSKLTGDTGVVNGVNYKTKRFREFPRIRVNHSPSPSLYSSHLSVDGFNSRENSRPLIPRGRFCKPASLFIRSPRPEKAGPTVKNVSRYRDWIKLLARGNLDDKIHPWIPLERLASQPLANLLAYTRDKY